MKHEEIVTRLLSLTRPNDPIYENPMKTVLNAIVRRLGQKALDLSPEDLESAREGGFLFAGA